MLRFMVVKDEGADKFFPTVFVGPRQVWTGAPSDESNTAFEQGNEFLANVFMNLFMMSDQAVSTETALWVLDNIDPRQMESEALEHQSYNGGNYTEVLLNLIKERISAA